MLPDETGSSDDCPTIRWNGITYWVYSHTDNSIMMTVVARDESDEIITRIIEKNGARYLNNITVDYDAETITLIGQSQDTITFPWTDLIEGGVEIENPKDWLCQQAYYGTGDYCDCGCGIPDPDCDTAGCSPPGCFDEACGYCWAEGGGSMLCMGDYETGDPCPEGPAGQDYNIECMTEEYCLAGGDYFIEDLVCETETDVCCAICLS
jgi:hypothetical protein